MKRRIILPNWVKDLVIKCDKLEVEVNELKRQRIAENEVKIIVVPEVADNVKPILQPPIIKPKLKAVGHTRKSIHTPTFSSESKISMIAPSLTKVLNSDGLVTSLENL